MVRPLGPRTRPMAGKQQTIAGLERRRSGQVAAWPAPHAPAPAIESKLRGVFNAIALELDSFLYESAKTAADIDIGVTSEGSAAGLPNLRGRFQRLFQESPLPMLVLDGRTLRFLAVNQAAA